MIRFGFVLFLFLNCWGVMAQENEEYRLIAKIPSASGVHFKYQLYKDGLPVVNCFKACFFHRGISQCRFQVDSLLLDEVAVNSFLHGNKQLLSSDTAYCFIEGEFVLVKKKEYLVNKEFPVCIFWLNDEIIHYQEMYAFQKDTTVQFGVYYPNPIVSSGTTYGNPILDNNDANSVYLEGELVQKSTQLNVNSSGRFELKNQFVKIAEFSSPSSTVPVFNSATLSYNRSDQEFEALHAFYHGSRLIDLVQDTLGFRGLVSDTIQMDVHALSGADNSMFRTASSPQILFGDGGVDDAEDAQVIVHELTHALFNFSSPNSNNGTERNAVDEGSADFMAAYYSYRLTGEYIQEIPSWDGHNEYWEGRLLNSAKIYPQDISGNVYSDGEIWSSTLLEIAPLVGMDKTTRLLLESSFFYYTNMSMVEAAQYFIKADSLLYNGSHTLELAREFCNKGLLLNCSYYLPETGADVYIDHRKLVERKLRFSAAVSNYHLMNIYDSSGRLCFTRQAPIGLWYNLDFLKSGIYIVELMSEKQKQTLKIILL